MALRAINWNAVLSIPVSAIDDEIAFLMVSGMYCVSRRRATPMHVRCVWVYVRVCMYALAFAYVCVCVYMRVCRRVRACVHAHRS